MPRSRKDRIIPVAPVDRLIRKAVGAKDTRVSDKGAERLAQILEEIGESIAKQAYQLTDHAGRKTISEKDMDLAYKLWSK